jgi:hypothetical protein
MAAKSSKKTKIKKTKSTKGPVLVEEVKNQEISETLKVQEPHDSPVVVEEVEEGESERVKSEQVNKTESTNDEVESEETAELETGTTLMTDKSGSFFEKDEDLPLANDEKIVQNASENMEPEQDLRRPESQNMWSETSTTSSNGKKSGGKGVMVLLATLLLIAALAGGYFWYQHHKAEEATGEESTQTDQTSEITEEATPTPTPTVAVNRADWTIDVLNGTSTPGLAKKVADELKALGYNIGTVGNASGDHSTSELHVTSADETKATDILPDFKTYGATEVTADLTKAASMSAQLIIGDNYSGASSTSDTTPTPEE